jgi:hypothetical protein
MEQFHQGIDVIEARLPQSEDLWNGRMMHAQGVSSLTTEDEGLGASRRFFREECAVLFARFS